MPTIRFSAFLCGAGRWMSASMLGALVVLGGCGTPSAATAMASPTAVQPPIHIVGEADTIEAHTPAEMCHWLVAADVTVASLGQGHWNTANGLRPAVDARDVMGNGYRIYTPVHFSRMQPFIDRRQDAAHSEIVALGGQAGQDSMTIDPYPMPKVGGRYVILLTPGADPATHGFSQRWVLISQIFPIDAQGMVQLQPQIIEQGQVSQQEVKMPLGDLTQQLAACH